MDLFSALGFHWNRAAVSGVVPTHSIERVTFGLHRMLDQFVWEASMLEGNPFTFVEVKTLLDGVTVGGRKISDHEQVLHLIRSVRHLLARVRAGTFRVDKATFTELWGVVTGHDAPGQGHFRGEGIDAGCCTRNVDREGVGRCPPAASTAGALALNRLFAQGLQALQSEVPQPFEKAAAFFLFATLHRFLPDANQCTSSLMMNGTLLSAGIDAISIPAVKAQEFNDHLVRFFLEKEATDMMKFLLGCHPDALR